MIVTGEGDRAVARPHVLSIGIPLVVLVSFLSLVAAASMWFYVDEILMSHQVADAALRNYPRGNLSDLYPRWLGARELLRRGRNPYSGELTAEIQRGYYGRALNPAVPSDPIDQQAFAYPVYVVFLLAPTILTPFPRVQSSFWWLLFGFSVAAVWWWLKALRWKLSLGGTLLCVVLLLGSFPEVQGLKLQQLSLLVAALLAAGAACVTSGYLFIGGAVIALATIKPQLALPFIAWILVWSVSNWKMRKQVAIGFFTVMALLLVASEIVLPGWLRMFWKAMQEYHRYTRNQSVLDPLVNWVLGPWGGSALAVLAVLASAALLWGFRGDVATSESFGRTVAFIMALSVLIIPMNSPYNQVLLLPSILLLVKDRERLTSTVSGRIVFFAGAIAFAWPWVCSAVLFSSWWVARPWAMAAWKLPLYSTFALPVLVFVLNLFSLRQHAVLRARAAQGSLEQRFAV